MKEVYQDTGISNRIADQVVQYEVNNFHQNTITKDVCKCVTHSIVCSIIIKQGTKITPLHPLVPLGKPHKAPKEARIV